MRHSFVRYIVTSALIAFAGYLISHPTAVAEDQNERAQHTETKRKEYFEALVSEGQALIETNPQKALVRLTEAEKIGAADKERGIKALSSTPSINARRKKARDILYKRAVEEIKIIEAYKMKDGTTIDATAVVEGKDEVTVIGESGEATVIKRADIAHKVAVGF